MSTMRAHAPSLAKGDGGRGGERGGHGEHGVCANEREYDDELVEGLGDSQSRKRLKSARLGQARRSADAMSCAPGMACEATV